MESLNRFIFLTTKKKQNTLAQLMSFFDPKRFFKEANRG